MPDEASIEMLGPERQPGQELPVSQNKPPLEIRPIAGGSQEADAQKEPSFEEKVKELIEGGMVKSEDLKLELKIASASRNQTPEKLTNSLDEIDKLLRVRKISEEEWEAVGGVLVEKLEEVRPKQPTRPPGEVEEEPARSKMIWTLPEDPVKQRETVIAALEDIESNTEPLSSPDNALATKIRSSLEKMEPRLKAECQARLRLQECYAYFSLISGSEEATKGLRAAIETVIRKGNVLVGRDFEVLLKEGLPNLRIAEAFKKLEDFAVNGRTWGGKDTVVHFRQGRDATPDQLLIMEEIKNELGGDKFAAKSLQLATRLATVTFETSVWNKELAGSDPLAEAIYLRDYRQGKAQSGQNRGPEITTSLISGFGTSFFRSAQLPKDGFIGAETKKERESKGLDMSLVPREKFSDSKLSDEIEKVQERTRLHNRIENGKTILLDFSSMELAKLDEGVYGRYLSNTIPRLLQVKEFLLRSDFKPDDFLSDEIEKWITPFKTADPDGIFRLKVSFVLGALDASLKKGERLGWGQRELAEVAVSLTRPLGTDERGKTIYFLNPRQQKWIFKEIHTGWKGAGIDARLSIRGVTRWTRR